MKIKVLVLALILCITAGTMVHAFGLGAQFNFSAGEIFAPGVSVLVSPADFAHLAFNWYIDFDNVSIIGLTFDLVPLVLPISTFKAGSFNFTFGVGLYTNLILADERTITGGLRIPVGFNLLLGPRTFEIFTHVAPSFGVDLFPSLALSNPFFPIALGARLWIRSGK